MALFERLKKAVRRPSPAPAATTRRPTTGPVPPDVALEDVLRGRLAADPNDAEAFASLADLVRRRAREAVPASPLTAPEPDDAARAADLAVWSLAEELAGRPRAWFPLVELARLSLADDHEAALRRLTGACDRDPSGRAVAEGVRMLREAGHVADALGLGVGHWAPQQHVPEAGRQVILAALDAGKPAEARRHLTALLEAPGAHAPAREVSASLEVQVAEAEELARTSAAASETGTFPAVVTARREGSGGRPASPQPPRA